MVEGLVARVWESRQPEYLGHTHANTHNDRLTGSQSVGGGSVRARWVLPASLNVLIWKHTQMRGHTLTHSHTSTGGDVCVFRRADRPGPSNLFPPWSGEIHRMQRASLTGVGKVDELSGKEWLHSVWQWLKHCREVGSLDSDKRVGWRWDVEKGEGQKRMLLKVVGLGISLTHAIQVSSAFSTHADEPPPFRIRL